jgi:hypothetical protein
MVIMPGKFTQVFIVCMFFHLCTCQFDGYSHAKDTRPLFEPMSAEPSPLLDFMLKLERNDLIEVSAGYKFRNMVLQHYPGKIHLRDIIGSCVLRSEVSYVLNTAGSQMIPDYAFVIDPIIIIGIKESTGRIDYVHGNMLHADILGDHIKSLTPHWDDGHWRKIPDDLCDRLPTVRARYNL